MCHWNEEGASCDTPEDTVESAHWLDPPSSTWGAAVCMDPTIGGVAPIAAGKRLAETTDQMLAQLEAQAQDTLERKKNRQQRRKRQRQPAASATAVSAHAPISRTQPSTVVPRAMLPSDSNDPAAATNFAALFAMGPDRPIILPGLTPSIQRLYEVGVKPHLGTHANHHVLSYTHNSLPHDVLTPVAWTVGLCLAFYWQRWNSVGFPLPDTVYTNRRYLEATMMKPCLLCLILPIRSKFCARNLFAMSAVAWTVSLRMSYPKSFAHMHYRLQSQTFPACCSIFALFAHTSTTLCGPLLWVVSIFGSLIRHSSCERCSDVSSCPAGPPTWISQAQLIMLELFESIMLLASSAEDRCAQL